MQGIVRAARGNCTASGGYVAQFSTNETSSAVWQSGSAEGGGNAIGCVYFGGGGGRVACSPGGARGVLVAWTVLAVFWLLILWLPALLFTPSLAGALDGGLALHAG